MIDARQMESGVRIPYGRLCGQAAMNPLKRFSHFAGDFKARLFGCVAQTVERQVIRGLKAAGSTPVTLPVETRQLPSQGSMVDAQTTVLATRKT